MPFLYLPLIVLLNLFPEGTDGRGYKRVSFTPTTEYIYVYATKK